MRKTGFFPRLALVNLVRNGRYYGPYLLSCGSLGAMFYILRFLTWNEVISTVRGAAYLQSMMAIGCFVVSLFSLVLLLYANSFVMKRRQRELGLYNILGLEKRHIAVLTVWETVLCALAAIPGGIAVGILLSKLILLLLLKLIRIPVQFGFSVSLNGVAETAVLLGVLFLVALAGNLFRLFRAKPVELLHSDSAGEREPRTRRLLAALGVVTLGAGYAIAVTTTDPMEALALFFLAVVLVIVGTYCLFTAGSIALLKRLRANRGFYYQTKHFTAVSGLLYRMKQNAVGLANICILACMVLVSVSGTVSLYLGMEDSLDQMFPHDIDIVQPAAEDVPAEETALLAENLPKLQAIAADSGGLVERVQWFTLTDNVAWWGGNTFTLADQAGLCTGIDLITADEYGRLTGRTVALAPDEVLVQEEGLTLPAAFFIEDMPLRVAGRIQDFPRYNTTVVVSRQQAQVRLVVAGEETLSAVRALAPDGFDRETRIQLDLRGTEAEKLSFLDRLDSVGLFGTSATRSRQDAEVDFYAMYGGFLFLGLFLGVLFLMATVLIIYYKQVSEGYQDQRRYTIMRQVGMTDREVRQSIRGQILLVFYLPLLTAGVHILAAFPMLCRILELFELRNVGLFAACTAGTMAVFCAVYALVYGLTARTYSRIVGA